MKCNECGKEHSITQYPFIIQNRLMEKQVCIECDRWIDLFDEIQVNPSHIMINGLYLVLTLKTFNEVKDKNFVCYMKDGYTEDLLFTQEIVIVGFPPKHWKPFFQDNAKIVSMEL